LVSDSESVFDACASIINRKKMFKHKKKSQPIKLTQKFFADSSFPYTISAIKPTTELIADIRMILIISNLIPNYRADARVIRVVE
jgi:hypothetical protein